MPLVVVRDGGMPWSYRAAPMRLGVLATQPHYVRHMRPIWNLIPGWLRVGNLAQADAVMVGGGQDASKAAKLGKPVVYVEHGAGQCYQGDRKAALYPGYSGGRHMEHVALFVCPSETVADRWRAVYPDAEVAVVGCPALDQWHTRPPRDRSERPVVTVTFHWPCRVCPEAGSAWPHFDKALPALVAEADRRGWELLGHEHPKWKGELNARWHRLGVPVGNWVDVMARTDLLVADNTSLLPEVASIGKPVVWLNSPKWRRDVEHGGRFWEWPQGQVVVEAPDDLVGGVEDGLRDALPVRDAREAMVRDVYAYTDGAAADRAARAVTRFLTTAEVRRVGSGSRRSIRR